MMKLRRKPGFYFSPETAQFYETIWMVDPSGYVMYISVSSMEWEYPANWATPGQRQRFWSKGNYEFISEL